MTKTAPQLLHDKINQISAQLAEVHFNGNIIEWLHEQQRILLQLEKQMKLCPPCKKTEHKLLTEEVIADIVSLHNHWHAVSNALYKCDIDIINMELLSTALHSMVKQYFGDSANDDVSWFLYDVECCKKQAWSIWQDEREFSIACAADLAAYRAFMDK